MAARPMQYLTTSSTQVGTSSSVVAAQLAESQLRLMSVSVLLWHPTRQAINLFLTSADQLYGPITTIRQHGRITKCIPWTTFSLSPADWECVNDTRVIIVDANNLQQYFSDEEQPTLFCAIPAFEEIQTAWEAKQQLGCFSQYQTAIQSGLDKLRKYYNKFDDKPVYVLMLVLHLYYKIDYIKMQWGGPEEQAKERAAGNANTVNWHDEAMKVLEWAIDDYWNDEETAPTRKNPPAKPAASVTLPKV